MGQIQNARHEETWAGARYEEGILITYQSAEKSMVSIWALKYEDVWTAAEDFAGVVDWTSATCGRQINVRLPRSGFINCGFSNAYDKILWNDVWMVDILALEGTEFTPEALVDKVREALAAHWQEIAQP